MLEEAAANDLETLVGAGRTPGRIDAADHVAKPGQGLTPAHASDLDIVGLSVVAGPVGRGQADDEEAVGREFGRLGEGLGEGELGLEGAGGQVAFVVQLAGVGDILVDQDQGRAVVCQQLTEGVAGVGGVLVVGAHAFVGSARFAVAASGMAQLPGKLAPQSAHLGAVRLGDWVAGRDAVADEDDSVDPRQFGHFGSLHDVVDAVQLAGLRAREQVIESEHGVGLAAAEVGLQLHDGLAALAVQALQSICQQTCQALGQVGAAEEFGRVAVFGGTLA